MAPILVVARHWLLVPFKGICLCARQANGAILASCSDIRGNETGTSFKGFVGRGGLKGSLDDEGYLPWRYAGWIICRVNSSRPERSMLREVA